MMHTEILIYSYHICFIKTFGKKYVLFSELKSKKKIVFRCKTLEITVSYVRHWKSQRLTPLSNFPLFLLIKRDVIDPLRSKICCMHVFNLVQVVFWIYNISLGLYGHI